MEDGCKWVCMYTSIVHAGKGLFSSYGRVYYFNPNLSTIIHTIITIMYTNHHQSYNYFTGTIAKVIAQFACMHA